MTTRISADLLRGIFDYDPRTGTLTRKKAFGTRSPGPCSKGKNRHGYLTARVGRVTFQQHRLIWVLVTGQWPDRLIDHINEDGADNRWSNLRLADESQNSWNARRRSDNKTGYRGVSKHGNRFCANIRIGGHRRYLGSFATAEKAAAAYAVASKAVRGEFHSEREAKS